MACIHFLWFFGIHGSNIFEPVTQSVFTPVDPESVKQAASNIFTKEFFDVFVLMGGCGATLCLIIAFMTQKRKSNARNVMGMDNISLSINISPLQMEPHIILPQFRSIIEKTGVNPAGIEIEITEQIAINQMGAALEIIEKFKEMGFKIAIDDFGMGHTSLLVLKKFQVDTVKLDGSLVKDIADNCSSRDVISSIISLAEKGRFSVVAEFVETTEQRDMLYSLGCIIYQGWLYSKALLPNEFWSYYKETNYGRLNKT
jgi:EAL domain-containing protein (putative c-di-GMP-specific phosphodiesterase class I)